MNKDENLKEKLNEIIQQENAEKGRADTAAILPLPICISLGASLGLVFGSFQDNLSMGLCFGLIGGCAVYGIIAAVLHSKKKRHPSEEEKSEEK